MRGRWDPERGGRLRWEHKKGRGKTAMKSTRESSHRIGLKEGGVSGFEDCERHEKEIV